MLTEDILSRLSDRANVLALDGPCASGKTSLAEALQKETGCSVVHMDHFFLRPEQRTEARLAEPGGNLDRERFWQEVALPLKRGESFSYRPFSCHTGELGKPISVKPGKLVVIEGSYSCHPALWELSTMRLFMTVAPEEQQRRILARNGETGLQMFQTRWIPLENRYFTAYEIAGKCDGIVNTERQEIRWRSF